MPVQFIFAAQLSAEHQEKIEGSGCTDLSPIHAHRRIAKEANRCFDRFKKKDARIKPEQTGLQKSKPPDVGLEPTTTRLRALRSAN
jgi:hypothetical protein